MLQPVEEREREREREREAERKSEREKKGQRERERERWMKAEREGRIRGGVGGLEKCVCWEFFFPLSQMQCGEGVKIC